MTATTPKERRKYERQEFSATATLTYDGHGPVVLYTRDLSDGGVFLKKGEGTLPLVGTEVYLDIEPSFAKGEPMIVKAEVVRVTNDGIGVVFIE